MNRLMRLAKFIVSIFLFVIFIATFLLHRPEQVQGQNLACPLTGGTIVEFGTEIRADKGEDQAQAGPVAVSLPAGTYRVTLVSYNDHTEKPFQEQPAEQWYLIFRNNDETVATSRAIRDLPEDQDWLIEVVEFDLVVPQPVTSLVAFHPTWPDQNPNSVTPVCAMLHQTDPGPTETPIATPAESPTPTASPTPTVEPALFLTPAPTSTSETPITPTPAATEPPPTVTPTTPPSHIACTRFNFEIGRNHETGSLVPGLYLMREIGTGSTLATWWAEQAWEDSGWITDIYTAFPAVWVEVFFYPYGNEPAVKMDIVNPAYGTDYGWLVGGICHAIEIEFPAGWSP